MHKRRPDSPEPDNTARSRELGEIIREKMRLAGFNGKQAARRLDWSEPKLSRIVTGQVGATDVDTYALCVLFNIIGKERDFLITLARNHVEPGWLQHHDSQVPEEVRTLISHEEKAVTIQEFDAVIVPGLLQTHDYARALLERSALVAADEIDNRITARRARHDEVFNRAAPPEYVAFIHESALLLPVGDAAIMSAQLHYLIQLCIRPNVHIRVIPYAFGAHAGIAGSFRLMTFEDHHPVAYVEEPTAGNFIERPKAIEAYGKIFTVLANSALDEEESKSFITALAMDGYSDGKDDDDLG
jgi:plasmid maintenance system antidote protein VapI